jgi:predicted dehydrogenase
MRVDSLHIGIIGAGGFARFAAGAFSTITGVKVAAAYDVNKNVAEQLAAVFDARVYDSYNELLQDENIDLVYIATPPFLHFEQSRMALLAGKHVICEKPAAFKSVEAELLRDLANTHNLLYVVNLMQRYNPLYQTVKQIIGQQLLGNFLHGYFENYASDELLNVDHWFWDEKKSGGIFIEHGVHFFDMFSGWFGKGEVLNAIALKRPGISANITDRVQATMLYNDSIVNIYHGFDQPKIMDRQELRLQFERGDITLYEWVPVQMKLHAILGKKDIENLKGLSADIVVKPMNGNLTHDAVKGRFKIINYDEQIIAEAGDRNEKQKRYEEILIAMLSDQWSWINNRNHKREVDAENAVESVRLAERATLLANNIPQPQN